MAAPTYVSENEASFAGSATPLATGSFSVLIGDVLIDLGVSEGGAFPGEGEMGGGSRVPTNSGTAHSWTNQEAVEVNDYCRANIATAVSAVDQSNTVSLACAGGKAFGHNCVQFRDSDGIGAAEKANVLSGEPSLDITTTQANSAIVVAVGDWTAADGSSRTWRTVNSVTPTAGNGYELTYYRDAARYTVYIAYYPDVGAAGTKTVGLSAPGSQKYSIVAVEVKGEADPPVDPPLSKPSWKLHPKPKLRYTRR